LTFSGFHRLNALTGPPDHDLHDRQWQYPIASGSPETSSFTAPQKHSPLCVAILSLLSGMHDARLSYQSFSLHYRLTADESGR
jgi:hypothetical protein